jgi:uncharacterized protein (DUF697 family)
MKPERGFWAALHENFLTPKVSQEDLEQCLDRIRGELPTPVFWLLGKAQSGKTSLIRALTGSSRAEIGNGFRPCTRTAQRYPFPNEEERFLEFLDTRGLGEVNYDPSEDMRILEDQSHLLIVVIKAMDHAQQAVLVPLRKILKTHPAWPLLVVQTALHEGYPTTDTQHLVPYPFGQFPFPPQVPADLARSLASQRELFASFDTRFVPVDFTLPEDGYNVEHYGLDALWSAIEEALPLGLRGMLYQTRQARQSLRDVYFRTAHPHVLSYALAAGTAAGLPVPLVDVPLVMAIQGKMFHTLASIYGQQVSRRQMAEIGGTLGVGYALRLGGRELLKLIPGLGSAMSALYAAASTYALGRTLCVYFSHARHGDVPDSATLRKLYAEQYEEGRRRMRAYFEHLVANRGNHSGNSAPQQGKAS